MLLWDLIKKIGKQPYNLTGKSLLLSYEYLPAYKNLYMILQG